MADGKKKKITITVNDQERIITADPESPLPDSIRDDMRESPVIYYLRSIRLRSEPALSIAERDRFTIDHCCSSWFSVPLR